MVMHPLPRYYSTIHQVNFMKSAYPQFKQVWRNDYEVEFIGTLHVSEKFPEYKVSILYRSERAPIVKMLNPLLVEKPPHFYQNTGSLCLYHPCNYKWVSGKVIAKDIVPWTSAWIYFYEVWLKTKV
jgi:hypothetical protein